MILTSSTDTRLADRTAHAASTPQDQQSQPTATSTSSISPKVPSRKPSDQGPATPDALAAARADLSAAQRSRAELQDQLSRTSAELEKLKKKNGQDSRRIGALEGERTHLTLRLRDRDEELRGKAKLLDVWFPWSFYACLWLYPLLPLGELQCRV